MRTSAQSVAIYARVSSDRQTRDNTIASQVAVLRERVAQDGYALSDALCFIGDGCSGSTLLRPALERLRDAAAGALFDRLYMLAPDRLARRQAHQALLLDELQRCHIEVVFLNRAIGASAEDELLVQVQGVIAEYERAKIQERSRRGKRHAAHRGAVSVFSTGALRLSLSLQVANDAGALRDRARGSSRRSSGCSRGWPRKAVRSANCAGA
jgi:site-specific DNA recombinase